MGRKEHARTCSECGKGMNEGYCVESGEAYYCSDECLHKHISSAEWEDLYDDGNGDSYWTDWSEDPDAFDEEDDEGALVTDNEEEL